MLAGVSKPHRSTSSRRGRRIEWLLFAAATLLSAFLLFLVQPLVAKHILPWFGGAPAVWNVCMAFYQSALFGGYLYAHFLITRIPPSRQFWVHGALVFAAFALLPVLPAESWRPDGAAAPGGRIFLMLISSVGLPFVALAGTGPILQALFAKRFPGTSPYPLYASAFRAPRPTPSMRCPTSVRSSRCCAFPSSWSPGFRCPRRRRSGRADSRSRGFRFWRVCGWPLRAVRSRSGSLTREPANTIDQCRRVWMSSSASPGCSCPPVRSSC